MATLPACQNSTVAAPSQHTGRTDPTLSSRSRASSTDCSASTASDKTIDNSTSRHPRILKLEEEWLNISTQITIFPDNTTFLASVKRQCLEQENTAAAKELQGRSDAEIAILGYKDEITVSPQNTTLLEVIKRRCLEQKSAAASKVLQDYCDFMARNVSDLTAQQHYNRASGLYNVAISLQGAIAILLQEPRCHHDKTYYDPGDGLEESGGEGVDVSEGVNEDEPVIRKLVKQRDNLVKAGNRVLDINETQRDELVDMARGEIRAAEAIVKLDERVKEQVVGGDTEERPFKRRRPDAEASTQKRGSKRTRGHRIIKSS